MNTIKDSTGKEYLQSESGTCYNIGTSQKVIERIENAKRTGQRIRVWYGDKDGKSWNEENDICGTVGRSTGSIKIPLLISKSSSFGGGALLTDRIIKIVDTKTKYVLYQHENFSQSFFGADDTIVWEGAPGDNETIYANCKTPEQAQRLADFMNGKRMSK